MSSYSGAVKGGKLKLKGHKSLFKSDPDRKRKRADDGESSKHDPDIKSHGGWWSITDECDLKGGINVAFECANAVGYYMAAMDNGKFTVGAPRADGETPAPEEILTLIKSPDDTKISLKTGYGKYVGVDAQGQLVAVADAIGARERLQVIFEDGKTALQAVSSGRFISFKTNAEGYIFASSLTAKSDEIVKVRTNAEKSGPVDWRSAEDKKKAKECESDYVKIYQHSKVELKGKHISIDVNDKKSVKKAQADGDLHEHLLHRRMKTKSDKYC